jgi:hypothetical protein
MRIAADENCTFSRLLALLGEKYGETPMRTVLDPAGGTLKTPVLVNGTPLIDPNLTGGIQWSAVTWVS